MRKNPLLDRITRPRAITMWDFSWLERRWPGAGYEDWDRALDELQERGYDAVRIDAYPHLVANGPAEKTWRLNVLWTQQDWGSPAPIAVCVLPALIEFIGKCARRGVLVALSSWFRDDEDHTRMSIVSPAEMARIWRVTLGHIARAGLLEHIWFVDLCNEFPGAHWSPFFVNNPPELVWGAWDTPEAWAWIIESVDLLRQDFPDLAYTYSFNPLERQVASHDLTRLDLLEPHIWMCDAYDREFFRTVGYDFQLTDPAGYHNLQRHALATYRARPAHWHEGLRGMVAAYARVARRFRRPLVTTECWSIVDYKDWPGLDWEWVKESCALGVELAVSEGAWAGIATSNFCGPQFRGMWRDVAWHRRLTDTIRVAALPAAD